MAALESMASWPGSHAAAVVVSDAEGTTVRESFGDLGRSYELASVTKIASSLAVLAALGDADASLDDPVGPPGSTLAHLLAHASGLPLDDILPIAPAGQRRIYSNRGIEEAVDHVAVRLGTNPAALVQSYVLEPLSMWTTQVLGSVASGAVGSTGDLALLAAEILTPTVLSPSIARQQRSVTFPGLVGVLPGYGRQTPCDWGLGLEVKGTKSPHWTGSTWSASTVGHFGQQGGFLAADVARGIALVTLGDAPFGPWAKAAWPELCDAVLAEADAA